MFEMYEPLRRANPPFRPVENRREEQVHCLYH